MPGGDVELVLFGWLLGIIGALVVPRIIGWYDEKKAIGRFKKQLKIEIKNIKNLIESQTTSYEKHYEAGFDDDAIADAIATKSLPIFIRPIFRTEIFRTNFNLLILLDKKLQEKTNSLYTRIDTLNSIPEIYKELPNESEGAKKKLIVMHMGHLKHALNQTKEIIKEL